MESKVDVIIFGKVYKTGRKCAAGFKKAMKPKWNYRGHLPRGP